LEAGFDSLLAVFDLPVKSLINQLFSLFIQIIYFNFAGITLELKI